MTDKIDITIIKNPNPHKKRKGSVPGRRKGHLFSRRRVDELERRVRPGGGINFWDLGQMRADINSPFVENTYEILPVVSIDLGEGGFASYDEPSIADWESFLAPMLAVPQNQWKDRFKKLSYEEAEKYGVTIIDVSNPDTSQIQFGVGRANSRPNDYSGYVDLELPGCGLVDGARWSPDGFKILPGDFSSGPQPYFQVVDGGAFTSFGNGYPAVDWPNYGRVKVTSTNNSTAPAINFTLATNANIFLIPRLMFTIASKTELGEDEGAAVISSVIGPYRMLPRSLWLDRTDPHLNYPLFNAQEGGYVNTQQWNINPTNFSALLSFISGSSLSAHYTATYLGAGHGVVLSEGSGGDFNTAGIQIAPGSADDNRIGALYGRPIDYGWRLNGVIEQNGAFFYFWNYHDYAGTYGEITACQRVIILD